MFTKTTLKTFALIFIAGICLSSCKKDKKNDDDDKPDINKSPVCQILSPNDGTQISQGESITVEVNAMDEDGQIQKVEFYVSNSLKETKNGTPYNFVWNTAEVSAGDYTLKAVATDNGGYKKADSILVSVTGGSAMNGDTIYPGNILNASGFTIYTVSGQEGEYLGYLAGTNGYGDISKAQQFKLESETYSIKGGILWFGFKHINGNADLKIQIWDMDGNTGYTTQGEGNQICPGTVLASKAVPLSDIDTSVSLSEAHFELFDAPVEVSSDYAMGIDIYNLYSANDSIAIVTSVNGDGNNMELAWEQWSAANQGVWSTLNYSYSLDADIAIFPILASESAKVGGGSTFNGLQLSTPKRNFSRENIAVNYSLNNVSSNTYIEIFDLVGNSIVKENLGAKNAGQYTLYLSKCLFEEGKYIYILNADGKKLAKEFIIR